MSELTNTQIAEKAINLLRTGIGNSDKSTIIEAYDMITDNEDFSWEEGVLDEMFEEWLMLVEKGNEIIFS